MSALYIPLTIAYSTTVILWFVCNYFLKQRLWGKHIDHNPQKPYLELIFVVITAIVVLVIGQLDLKGGLIPNNSDNQGIDALNKFLIFSPTIVLVRLRKQSFESIWLPTSDILLRILIGLGMALASLFIYWMVRENVVSFSAILANIYNLKNLSHLIQIVMENVTIALIFVSLSKWIGNNWTIVMVALLFAAGHIPLRISSGFVFSELESLVLDMAVGILILLAVSKSKDVWWFSWSTALWICKSIMAANNHNKPIETLIQK